MPESADRSGRPDWSGQAAGNGGAAEAPADDWLRAELDDEYPLPPMPAPRPRLSPQPLPHSQSQPGQVQQQPPAQVLPPAAPRFGEAAQPTSAPLESLLGQPAAGTYVSSAPPSVPPSIPPSVPPSVLQPPIAPGGASSATPRGDAAFGASTEQPEQQGHPDQREPQNHIEQPLPEWVIVLSDGVSLPIYGPVVIGRNPSQERFPDASVSAVPDLTQTMSKTHARFWVDGDRLYVDDLNSTNGVALFPGGNAHGALAVEPGVPAELRSGDVVQLGEYRLSIRRS
ncbi:FHA domain-containing protein [Pseudoclavibacter sp. AY1F1]|uniref:FHA domain-containing protein n=1 Tax=Pseudoclavibacter sp. AY1F1 TaxID=2080583 RepID=UPI0015E42094|nr:FHA domain-containing protein [Pseudoclavibacter sp. AY1F1]